MFDLSCSVLYCKIDYIISHKNLFDNNLIQLQESHKLACSQGASSKHRLEIALDVMLACP